MSRAHLVLALGLRDRGIDVEAHEQADELREAGAAVALSANGVRELQRLGLGEALATISTEPVALSVRRWADGGSIVRGAVDANRPAVFSGTVGYRGLVPRADLTELPDAMAPDGLGIARRDARIQDP